jgi:hypothetical protein
VAAFEHPSAARDPRVASALLGGLQPRPNPKDHAGIDADATRTTPFERIAIADDRGDRIDELATTSFVRPDAETSQYVRPSAPHSAPYERMELQVESVAFQRATPPRRPSIMKIARAPAHAGSRWPVWATWGILGFAVAFAAGLGVPLLVM